MTAEPSNAVLARCGCLECRVALLVRTRGHGKPLGRSEPSWAEQDPMYRQQMRDSGHGGMLR